MKKKIPKSENEDQERDFRTSTIPPRKAHQRRARRYSSFIRGFQIKIAILIRVNDPTISRGPDMS